LLTYLVGLISLIHTRTVLFALKIVVLAPRLFRRTFKTKGRSFLVSKPISTTHLINDIGEEYLHQALNLCSWAKVNRFWTSHSCRRQIRNSRIKQL